MSPLQAQINHCSGKHLLNMQITNNKIQFAVFNPTAQTM